MRKEKQFWHQDAIYLFQIVKVPFSIDLYSNFVLDLAHI